MMLDTYPAGTANVDDQGARVAYARIGRGQVVEAWPTYEVLQRALPPNQRIELLPSGQWVREVEVGTGETTEDDGEVLYPVEVTQRLVALSLKEARDARLKGIEMDHWNGTTWIRRGVKPELDLAVMLRSPQARRIELRKAPPSERARHRAQAAQAAAAAAANSVEAAALVSDSELARHRGRAKGSES